jgi:hypothetical protein
LASAIEKHISEETFRFISEKDQDNRRSFNFEIIERHVCQHFENDMSPIFKVIFSNRPKHEAADLDKLMQQTIQIIPKKVCGVGRRLTAFS